MRTSFRHIAVVVPLVVIMLLGALPAWSQFTINSFDKTVADSAFNLTFNATANNTEPHPFNIMTDDATVKQAGAASLKNDWRIHTTEDWGGLIMISNTVPIKTDSSFRGKNFRTLYGDSAYLDWSAGTHLSLWYNPAVPSTAAGNGVQMRFHIYDGGPGSTYHSDNDNTQYEDWYFQTPLPLNDTPGWHELIIPLVDTGTKNTPSANGFCITDWSGKHHNDKLDLDRIIGWTIEWTAPKVPGDTAHGTVYYDDLRLAGLGQKAGYEPFYSFNNFSRDTANFNGGWNNGGQSGITMFEETVDTLMGGPANTGFDWKINVKESWGGGANREYNLPGGTFFPDLAAKSELQLFCKVVTPLTSSSGTIGNKISVRFVLFDYSDGTKEEWYTVADIAIDSIGLARGWQMVRMPLEWIQSGAWGDLKVGRFNTPNGTKDGILAFDKIGGFKIEFSSSRDGSEPFAADLVYSGKVIWGAVLPAGYRETDKTPPALVTGIQATPSTFSNIVTWSDVPGETGATYTVWASENSFSATTDAGVENIPPFAQPTGTQLITHLLRAPNTDQNVTLYYGVTASDSKGNTNQPAVIGPVTNMAKGVPTIAMVSPTNFAADGDISEWTTAGIKPFLLSVNPAHATATIVSNDKIDGDADLMANAYLSATAQGLYVAFDVDDDVVSIDTASGASSWLQDAPDLFIGLYDWRGARHGGYQHGRTPDYHLRFSQNKVIVDNNGSYAIATPGTNYSFTLKQLTPGYVVEAFLPWSAFKASNASDSLFSPLEGMRIPVDFELNDNDTPGNNTAREGRMCYSVLNNDLSYSDVWRWTYTWIGNKSTVGVDEQQPGVANVYELSQNYPNPFNPSTVIRYSLAQAGQVSVKVFDVLGRVVATLVNGEVQGAGQHQVVFSTSSAHGLSSGLYFYRIESGSFRDVKKMMLLK